MSHITEAINQFAKTAHHLSVDRWILSPDKWGGAIELSILCAHYSREIAAYDIRTQRCDLYGQGAGERRRSTLTREMGSIGHVRVSGGLYVWTVCCTHCCLVVPGACVSLGMMIMIKFRSHDFTVFHPPQVTRNASC